MQDGLESVLPLSCCPYRGHVIREVLAAVHASALAAGCQERLLPWPWPGRCRIALTLFPSVFFSCCSPSRLAGTACDSPVTAMQFLSTMPVQSVCMWNKHIPRGISIQANVPFEQSCVFFNFCLLSYTPKRSVICATQKELGCMPVLVACSGTISWVWALWALWAEDSPCSSSSHSTLLGPGTSLIAGAGACDYRKLSLTALMAVVSDG